MVGKEVRPAETHTGALSAPKQPVRPLVYIARCMALANTSCREDSLIFKNESRFFLALMILKEITTPCKKFTHTAKYKENKNHV